jgi:ribosomal protein S18 acetylase RimI-like enzyme
MNPGTVEIALATASHAAGIAAVHVRAWQVAYPDILDPDFLAAISIAERTKRWVRNLTEDPATTVIAVLEGEIIGFASWGHCRDESPPVGQGEIWAVYVHPDHWRRGVGKALLGSVLSGLRNDGYGSASLWVLSLNSQAIAFYESQGFSRVPDASKVVEIGGRQVEERKLLSVLQA